MKLPNFTDSLLMDKLKEAASATWPIMAIVFVVAFAFVPVPTGALLEFVFGGAFLIFGTAVFSLGADIAMMPIGSHIGGSVTRTKKLWFILFISLLVGIFVTISEPDLQVLAKQVPHIPDNLIIWSVAVGVGVFLLIAMARQFLGVSLQTVIVISYLLVLSLVYFVDSGFIGVAFDAGGVTTGPMTVPFLMALGAGVAASRSDSSSQEDSFGLVGIASIGPILVVLILGLFFTAPRVAGGSPLVVAPELANSLELWSYFTSRFPHFSKEITTSLIPIVIFFLTFQVFKLHLRRDELTRIFAGVLYTYIGLVIFMIGVNVGFLPVGSLVGQGIGELSCNWIIVPIGMLIGYFIVQAEPAVGVLNKQVAEITSGAIAGKALSTSLSIGVAVSVGLSMLRILLGFNLLYLLIPGYILAIALTRYCPPLFVAIAFDSGGVASGAMAATFLLPLAMGLCLAVGRDIGKDAFGVVAMIAMTPPITIQILGLIYKWQLAKVKRMEETQEITL